MVDIQSKEVIDKISDELKVQPAMAIPRALAEKLQLVYVVNPFPVTRKFAIDTKSTTGSVTLFVTNSVLDTFITSISLSVTSDATADNTSYFIAGQIFGQVGGQSLIILNKQTTTAESVIHTVNFNPPIKMTRNSVMTHGTAFTVGAATFTTIIFGYTTDPQ